MAVITTAKRASLGLSLNAGTNPDTGATVRKSMSIAGLKQNADPDKCVNVADLLAPCLELPVLEITRTDVVTLEKE